MLVDLKKFYLITSPVLDTVLKDEPSLSERLFMSEHSHLLNDQTSE